MRPALKRLLPRTTLARLRRWRDQHVHAVVADRDDARRAFAVFGDTEWTDHLVRVYLGGPPHVVTRRGLHGHDCTATAAALARRYGLVLLAEAQLPAHLEPRTLRVPKFVGLTTDLGADEAEFLKRLTESARSDVRRIRAAGFRWQTCRDAGWSGEFHRRYHQNAITRRHGREAFVMAEADIVRAVRDEGWEFVQVLHDGRCLGAMLGQPGADAYRVGRLGWLEGDPELVKRGVLAATYWFTFERARELGLRRVRLGGTPPYLEDGVFQFKMKWDAELDPTDARYGTNRLLLDPAHPDARRFLQQRSLVTQGPGGEFIVYSGRGPGDVRVAAGIRRSLTGWRRLGEDGFSDEPVTPTTRIPRPTPAA